MKKNKISEEMMDIPVETMYKYLLRDYRALQEENKLLKKKIDLLTKGIVDTDSDECRRLVKGYLEKFHHEKSKRLKERISELEREVEELKSRT